MQRSLPDDPSFQLLGMTEGVDETVRALQAQNADIIVVACQGREDDRSLQIIDGAHRAAPDVPIIVLSAASPNGFLRRAFEVGAADMAIFPQSKEQLRFAMSKAIARRPGLGSVDGERREGRLVCVLGPEGRDGQDAHVVATSRSRSRSPARRCWSSTSTCSSATWRSASAFRPRRRCTTSPCRAARSTRTSSRTTS